MKGNSMPYVVCKWCGTSNTIYQGYGKWDGGSHHRCRCLVCGRKFKDDLAPYDMRYPLDIIVFALDLFKEGIGYGRIATSVESEYGRKPSTQTIWAWCNDIRLRDRISRCEVAFDSGGIQWT